MRFLIPLSLALLAVFASQVDGKFYQDNLGINSRIPGDQLIWHPSKAVQKLDFFAEVRVTIPYPFDSLPSKYLLSHVHVTGTEETGYIDAKFDAGGPGTDSMRMKLILNSIKNGSFDFYLYGKKK